MEDTLLELTRRAVCCLVDSPDDIEVYVDDDDDDRLRLLISTAPGELGQVIGKQGRNLEALRTIVQSCAGKWHRRVEVELLEPV